MNESVVIERDSNGEVVTVTVRPALEVDEQGRTVETEIETERTASD